MRSSCAAFSKRKKSRKRIGEIDQMKPKISHNDKKHGDNDVFVRDDARLELELIMRKQLLGR